jgi:hypothetical protein
MNNYSSDIDATRYSYMTLQSRPIITGRVGRYQRGNQNRRTDNTMGKEKWTNSESAKSIDFMLSDDRDI